MTKLLCIMLISLSSLQLSGQFKEIEDAMSKGKHKGICLHLDTFNLEIAKDAVIKVIGDKDHKTNPSVLSFNELLFDNTTIQTISSKPVDFYAKFKIVDSSIVLFTDFGPLFLDSTIHPREFKAMNQIGIEIRDEIREAFRLINIDSLKIKVKALETQYKQASEDLKDANNTIKNNIKNAAINDKTVIETENKLTEEKGQIRAVDSIRLIKEKEFNTFPLEHLKAVNQSKNNALDKNRSTRKSLIKDNIKSSEKITEYETEITLNKSALEVAKEDPKATKKLMKANQQLNTRISDERLKITLNDARIAAINGIIYTDSSVVKSNDDSLSVFDENARRKELKQLENRKEKLVELTLKHQVEIEKNKTESAIRKKETEDLKNRLETMADKEAMLAKNLESTKLELKNLESKKRK